MYTCLSVCMSQILKQLNINVLLEGRFWDLSYETQNEQRAIL